jgi:hypothetical protein
MVYAVEKAPLKKLRKEWEALCWIIKLNIMAAMGWTTGVWLPEGVDIFRIGTASRSTWRSGFDPRQRQMIFSSNLCVQTGSEAHPASCTMGTGGPFPGSKRGRGVMLTTHPHLVQRSRTNRSYTSSPPSATMACSGTALLAASRSTSCPVRSEAFFRGAKSFHVPL